jgi:2'-5' RNA ligase
MLTKSIQQPVVKPAVMNWLKDCGVWEHLLVVNTSLDVSEKINAEKWKFASDYKEPTLEKTQSHIVIATFLAKEDMDATFMHPQFPVLLRNFSGFVPHTIYVQVQNVQPFKQLAKSLEALDHFIQASECPPLKLTTTPHLIIARRLSEETYFKALPYYLERTFQQSFTARKLTLLKRATSTAHCETVHVFPLAPEEPARFN